MNNKKYIQDISKKNIINLRRNSSLDSTKSSLRVKKYNYIMNSHPSLKTSKIRVERILLIFQYV